MENQNFKSRIISYINLIFDSFIELHGDRKSGDDDTVIAGLARLDGQKVVAIIYHNPQPLEVDQITKPEGYRKCSRLIQLAQSFSKPIIAFINISNKPTLLPSEQQHQINEAISRNLEEMACLTTPVIGVITDEDNLTAAFDVCAPDCLIILKSSDNSSDEENIISLDLSIKDMLDRNLIQRIVEINPEEDFSSSSHLLKKAISEELKMLMQIDPEHLVKKRLDRIQYQFLSFRKHIFPRG
jgi:acetyl-CoA carboxylase carboxyl transferase subunit alpha